MLAAAEPKAEQREDEPERGWAAKALRLQLQPANVGRIIAKVCIAFDVDPWKVEAHGRGNSSVVMARRVAMYLTRQTTRLSFPAIGRAFRRDHSTVISAVQAVEKLMAADERLRGVVERLLEEVEGSEQRRAP